MTFFEKLFSDFFNSEAITPQRLLDGGRKYAYRKRSKLPGGYIATDRRIRNWELGIKNLKILLMKIGRIFLCFVFKLAKSGKRGENDVMKWDVARPNNNTIL